MTGRCGLGGIQNQMKAEINAEVKRVKELSLVCPVVCDPRSGSVL